MPVKKENSFGKLYMRSVNKERAAGNRYTCQQVYGLNQFPKVNSICSSFLQQFCESIFSFLFQREHLGKCDFEESVFWWYLLTELLSLKRVLMTLEKSSRNRS
ncbi:hypothetical protein CDAR_397611 [Caerostris darwini]|uniref:Uncharacterized protein n=1 Tax=Caerostris darwini TaxID=1538125 RepID=A0AAV4TCR1_9ARAC|nr:hypothetical protein CDAR_397611 [Caerostris darwini]